MSKRRKSRTGRPSAPVIPEIATEGLSKSYGDVTALAKIDIEVPTGQAVVLVGHNGSGKSTLLGLIAGTMEPTEGEVRIAGSEPDSIKARTRRSWLPDSPVLYDDLTVDEHLRYIARLHGGTGDEPRLDELVQRLDLAERRDQLPSQFSRGLRQKTAIAVALCRPFSLLLVDEPFVGLDAHGRATMLDLLGEASADGATLMVATHDPEVISRFDRGLLMSNGEVIHDCDAAELPGYMTPDSA
jgi:ABC-type multidrug transport system ATPase subunit